MPNIRTDWSSVDWSKNNRELAELLNVAYGTVAKKRWELGKSGIALTRKTRKDKGISKTTCIPTKEQQQKAVKAAQASPIAGKSEKNIHAKWWKLTSPDNQIYVVRNLYHFIRQNTHLFAPADVIWKRKNGKRGTGGEYCNATAGLSNIPAGRAKSWKGWKAEIIKIANK